MKAHARGQAIMRGVPVQDTARCCDICDISMTITGLDAAYGMTDLGCLHRFHASCLVKWCKESITLEDVTQRRHANLPLCPICWCGGHFDLSSAL